MKYETQKRPPELIERARRMRRNMTIPETLLWRQLRRRQVAGHKFRRQAVVGQYIVDFMCFEKRLIVEVDGGQHGEAAAYDRQRDCWLSDRGYRVLRFWNEEVLQDLGRVLATIADVVR
jgi:very-short-patch-repair endonuclease